MQQSAVTAQIRYYYPNVWRPWTCRLARCTLLGCTLLQALLYYILIIIAACTNDNLFFTIVNYIAYVKDKFHDQRDFDNAQLLEDLMFLPRHVMMISAACIGMIGAVAQIGAVFAAVGRRSRTLLMSLIANAFLLLPLGVSLLYTVLLMSGSLPAAIEPYSAQTLSNRVHDVAHADMPLSQSLFDELHSSLRCCGLNSSSDFWKDAAEHRSEWMQACVQQRTVEGDEHACYVPASCCDPTKKAEVVEGRCNDDAAITLENLFGTDVSEDNWRDRLNVMESNLGNWHNASARFPSALYSQSCSEKLRDELQRYPMRFVYVTLPLLVIDVVSLSSAAYLYQHPPT